METARGRKKMHVANDECREGKPSEKNEAFRSGGSGLEKKDGIEKSPTLHLGEKVER